MDLESSLVDNRSFSFCRCGEEVRDFLNPELNADCRTFCRAEILCTWVFKTLFMHTFVPLPLSDVDRAQHKTIVLKFRIAF